MNEGYENAHKPANVLIVDDTPANLQILGEMLQTNGYRARPVISGKMALQAAHAETPDLILLDINMPEMNGYEVCRSLKADEKLKDIPVIFISAYSETMDKVKAFAIGGVDYINKPFHIAEVLARVDAHLQLRRLRLQVELHNRNLQDLVDQQVKDISSSHSATIIALAKLAEYRDNDTGRHLERVQIFCKLLASRLAQMLAGRERIDAIYIENIYHASPLHDIGKVSIPDSLLLKPARLTTEEFEVMKTHAARGAQLLESVRNRYPKNALVNMGINIARSHHERWDGTGYPDGKAEENIPLSARIMSVADVYDALTSRRCYKQAIAHDASCEMIAAEKGRQFDPGVIDAFMELREEFRGIREDMKG